MTFPKMEVDLVLLSRDLSPPRPDVWRGIHVQDGVKVRTHRLVGTPAPEDPNRWETIARARNDGKHLGTTPWVMYLDDDVVLGSLCVARLVEGLLRRPRFAALAADSAGEMRSGLQNWDYPAHVGMAATLFRRERLAGLTFRWAAGKCECRCCCEDLRRQGLGIGYLPDARAWHRPARARAERLISGDRACATKRARRKGGGRLPGRSHLDGLRPKPFRQVPAPVSRDAPRLRAIENR